MDDVAAMLAVAVGVMLSVAVPDPLSMMLLVPDDVLFDEDVPVGDDVLVMVAVPDGSAPGISDCVLEATDCDTVLAPDADANCAPVLVGDDVLVTVEVAVADIVAVIESDIVAVALAAAPAERVDDSVGL